MNGRPWWTISNFRSRKGHHVGNGLRPGAPRITVNGPAGVLLLATPQLGSGRVPGIFSGLNHDLQALRRNGPPSGKVRPLLSGPFSLRSLLPVRRQGTHTPCWALIASEDFWVDSLSAGIALEESLIRTVRASHTSIVKPQNKTADSYQHLNQFVRESMKTTRGERHFHCSPACENDLRLIHETRRIDLRNRSLSFRPHEVLVAT